METRRFDELTVAIARGGSRRGMLRGLAGGLLGALALDRSGVLAKNDNENNGRGKPITEPAKPICPNETNTVNCPLCYEARFGPEGDGTSGCCDINGRDKECENCNEANKDFCLATSPEPINSGQGTCVRAYCTQPTKAGTRCEYTKDNEMCGDGAFCCDRFTHENFGHCVNTLEECGNRR
jgi:hypothetical protein